MPHGLSWTLVPVLEISPAMSYPSVCRSPQRNRMCGEHRLAQADGVAVAHVVDPALHAGVDLLTGRSPRRHTAANRRCSVALVV